VEVQVRLEVSASPTLEALLSRMLAGMAVTPTAPAVSDSEGFPAAGELDREGTPFDPAAHTGLKTTKGAWRKKRTTAAEVAAELEAEKSIDLTVTTIPSLAVTAAQAHPLTVQPPEVTEFLEKVDRIAAVLVAANEAAIKTTETVSKSDTDDLDSLDEPAPVKITMDEHVRPRLKALMAKGKTKEEGTKMCRLILKANGSVDGTIGGLKEEAYAAAYAQLGAKLEELSK
jgi:hypothetical protein